MRNEENTKQPIYVTRASLPPFEEYEALIGKLWESHVLTNMGCFHEELRAALAEYLGCGGIELFVNGHMALEMLLQAFELKGEVITTPFTFASTTHAIVRNGLTPVMCDVRESDGTMDAERIEALITERTSAIVPVHVYGNVCDDEAIMRIAKRHGLRVIYDAAHAFGETVTRADGTKTGVGCLGDASMFSFHATKVFNTIEGGAVTWKDGAEQALGTRLYQLKNFGITDKEHVDYVGGNGKMNEFAAAMGLCNLRHVDEWIAARGDVCARYRENLTGLRGVRLMEERGDVESNHAYMPVVFAGGSAVRDAVYEALSAEGIFPRKYFYPCVNAYQCYAGVLDPDQTPTAKRLAASVLTLPLYPELPRADIDRICGVIAENVH